MKKFIGTSPKFAGEIHIVYGDDERLRQIDFMPAELSNEQTEYFTRMIPTLFDKAFMRGFAKTEMVFVEESYEVTFEMFWQKYGKKLNPDRCKALFARLSKTDQVKAFFGINAYERHLKANSWKSKADPQTYLREKRWNNEYE